MSRLPGSYDLFFVSFCRVCPDDLAPYSRFSRWSYYDPSVLLLVYHYECRLNLPPEHPF